MIENTNITIAIIFLDFISLKLKINTELATNNNDNSINIILILVDPANPIIYSIVPIVIRPIKLFCVNINLSH